MFDIFSAMDPRTPREFGRDGHRCRPSPPACRPLGLRQASDRPQGRSHVLAQSACLRRKAGISISSMPLLASASTLAAAWVRALRQTLGVFSPV